LHDEFKNQQGVSTRRRLRLHTVQAYDLTDVCSLTWWESGDLLIAWHMWTIGDNRSLVSNHPRELSLSHTHFSRPSGKISSPAAALSRREPTSLPAALAHMPLLDLCAKRALRFLVCLDSSPLPRDLDCLWHLWVTHKA